MKAGYYTDQKLWVETILDNKESYCDTENIEYTMLQVFLNSFCLSFKIYTKITLYKRIGFPQPEPDTSFQYWNSVKLKPNF